MVFERQKYAEVREGPAEETLEENRQMEWAHSEQFEKWPHSALPIPEETVKDFVEQMVVLVLRVSQVLVVGAAEEGVPQVLGVAVEAPRAWWVSRRVLFVALVVWGFF